jgi:ABC-type nitrate/sulfonate/bicarbonate transport system permease component
MSRALASLSVRQRWTSRLAQVTFLLSLLGAWYAATRLGHISPFLLPPPGKVAVALRELIATGSFLPNLGVTLGEVAIAFSTATVFGLLIGYGVSRAPAMVRIFEPLLSSLYAVPIVLFLPLFILLFGLGIGSKIAMGIVTSFFPVVLSAIAGFANVERIYVTAARSMGCSGYQLLRCVLLPAALPVVVSGLRMAFIVAFLSILSAETIASYAGLGHGIVEHAEDLETDQMFANIVLVIAIAAIINIALGVLERRMSRHG